MSTLRYLLALPFVVLAWVFTVIALYLGGPKTGKGIVRFVRSISEKVPGIENV